MSKVNSIVFNRDIQASWIRKQTNKNGRPQLDIGKRYIKGKLTKIHSEKLNPDDKNALYYDLIFDDGSIFRVGGIVVNKLI